MTVATTAARLVARSKAAWAGHKQADRERRYPLSVAWALAVDFGAVVALVAFVALSSLYA